MAQPACCTPRLRAVDARDARGGPPYRSAARGQFARIARAAGCHIGGDVNDVLPELNSWIERGDRFAIATVVAVKKSAPRPPGAKMAVNENGEIIGAVSGGCVEG